MVRYSGRRATSLLGSHVADGLYRSGAIGQIRSLPFPGPRHCVGFCAKPVIWGLGATFQELKIFLNGKAVEG